MTGRPSLYEILGVAGDAGDETIRAAYRKMAKAAHPDSGGSSEAFAALKTAHDVLTDAERRRHYDRTGDTDIGAARHIDSMARGFIDNFVHSLVEARDESFQCDLIGQFRAICAKNIAAVQQQQAAFRLQKARLQRFKAGLRAPESGVSDIVSAAADTKIRMIDLDTEKLTMTARATQRAIDLVEGYGFDAEPSTPVKARINVSTSSTTWW